MATFSIAPDYGSPVEIEPRVLRGQFGDGYAQRTADGINHIAEKWDLTFGVRTPAEADAILTFLRARGGTEAFDWTSPTGTTGRWTCPRWSYVPNNAATNTITARFEQDFSPS